MSNMKGFAARGALHACAIVLCLTAATWAESVATVRGRLSVSGAPGGARSGVDAVIWLTPLSGAAPPSRPAAPRPSIIQRNKRFETPVLVVPVGSEVAFPNLDPFFHNVFSLFDGKRFDLGLYEAGSSRSVRFDRAGVCYIFCNIHSQMSAAVIVLDTPYFTQMDASGEFQIPGVPAGRYRMEVWAARSSPNDLRALSREIDVAPGDVWVGAIELRPSAEAAVHPNKYGQEYDTQVFPSPIYALP